MTRTQLATLFVALGATVLLFVDLCAALYDCGCLSLWRGASSLCNIHAARGPHCPWCMHPILGGGVAFVGTMAVQVWVVLAPGPLGALVRLAGALAAFPIVSGILGIAQGLLFGYWGRP